MIGSRGHCPARPGRSAGMAQAIHTRSLSQRTSVDRGRSRSPSVTQGAAGCKSWACARHERCGHIAVSCLDERVQLSLRGTEIRHLVTHWATAAEPPAAGRHGAGRRPRLPAVSAAVSSHHSDDGSPCGEEDKDCRKCELLHGRDLLCARDGSSTTVGSMARCVIDETD